MRIDQITPSKRYSDGINNAVLVLQKAITDIGIDSDIFAEGAQWEANDKVIYHLLLGSQATQTLAGTKATGKVLFYHGITPPEYLANQPEQNFSLAGQKELKVLSKQFTVAITNTKYHEHELHHAGYERTMVLPPPVDIGEYEQQPDTQLINKYEDDHTNLLFAGQLNPSNKLEDTISLFNYYHKKINPKSRLFLVGNYSTHPWYSQKLLALIKELQINNVFLTGRVSLPRLLAYYRLAHVFLCMSEYEALAAPIVTAMYQKVPVVAFDHAAVQEVLGGAGCLINEKDFRETARLLDRLISDWAKREEVITRQLERVAAFLPQKVFPLYREAMINVFKVGGDLG